MTNIFHPIPMASATVIFVNGNHRDAVYRLRFLNQLISFADLDGYEHRAAFIAAFATGGSEDARRLQADLLADSCLLSAHDLAYCAAAAESGQGIFTLPGFRPEIV